jgi:hypothetical protein
LLLIAVSSALDYGEDFVSVGREEVEASNWTEQVFKPDVLAKWTFFTRSRAIDA